MICERELIIFLEKIIATIFDFCVNGRLGRERNLYQLYTKSVSYLKFVLRKKARVFQIIFQDIGKGDLTPISDKEKFPSYNIKHTSDEKKMHQLGACKLIQYQILQLTSKKLYGV